MIYRVRAVPDAPAALKPINANWQAVWSLSFGMVAMITGEFLPATLLTPVAQGLHVTVGVAGQAVTATAFAALITSLVISGITYRVDRRWVLLAAACSIVASNLLAAIAPDLAIFFIARVLLGIGHGTFLAMMPATVMRLVPSKLIARSFSLVYGGVSVALLTGSPLASFLGNAIGWRGAFVMGAGLGLAALIWQFISLPSMMPRGLTRISTVFRLLKRPKIAVGILALLLVYTGHYAFFTYMRPFVEGATALGRNGFSIILIGYGIANIVGVLLSGPLVARKLWLMLFLSPLFLGIIAVSLVTVATLSIVKCALVILWGFGYGTVPVAWSAWITRVAHDEAESGGGLMVATIQLGISAGAAVGGVAYDRGGASYAFTTSGLILAVAAVVTLLDMRVPSVIAHP